MAATFNPSLITPLDVARQRLGDTDVNDALFPDETYTVMLGSGASAVLPVRVAARLAMDLSARYARKVTQDVDNQGKRYSDLTKHYRDLAGVLSAEADTAERQQDQDDIGGAIDAYSGGVMVSGASRAEVEAWRCNPDNPDNANWLPNLRR